jgi:hypothetical protein
MAGSFSVQQMFFIGLIRFPSIRTDDHSQQRRTVLASAAETNVAYFELTAFSQPNMS